VHLWSAPLWTLLILLPVMAAIACGSGDDGHKAIDGGSRSEVIVAVVGRLRACIASGNGLVPGRDLPVVDLVLGEQPWWQLDEQTVRERVDVGLVHRSQRGQLRVGVGTVAQSQPFFRQDLAQAKAFLRRHRGMRKAVETGRHYPWSRRMRNRA
jgi:hypothetical protein